MIAYFCIFIKVIATPNIYPLPPMRFPKLTLLLGAAALVVLAVASPALRAGDEPTNLLVNGDFALQDSPTAPANWKTEQTQKVSIDTADKPEGVAQALKVEIIADGGKNQGSISQEVKVEPGKFYKVSGWVTGSAPRFAFIQVKLREGKKEGDRIPTDFGDSQWKEVSKVFSSKTADNLLIICRFNQKAELKGQTCEFANLKLVEATEDEAAAATAEAPAEQK